MLLLWSQFNPSFYCYYKISLSIIALGIYFIIIAKILYDINDESIKKNVLDYCKDKYINYLQNVQNIILLERNICTNKRICFI